MDPKQRLRILHIGPSLTVGGAEQIACHLMVGLSQTHEVAAAGLFGQANSPVEKRLQEAGIPMWHLNKRRGFDAKMFSALDGVLRDFRPEIIHTQMSVLRYVFPVLLRRPIPAVHTLQNVAEHETDGFGRMVHWIAFRSGIHPVAVSQEVAASVERVYRLKCTAVIPNCVPVAGYRASPENRIRWREEQGFAPDDFLFTCVGRLEPQKNPFLLVDAFAEVQDPRAHLAFLGEGTLTEPLRARIEARGLSRRVHPLGKRNNIPEILAASDVFVLGSNWEGNPLAVMEAMAAGLPVISTAVGGVPELIQSGKHGLLVAPGDHAAFANAMRTLLADPLKRSAIAAAAQTRANAQFDSSRMVREYSSLFHSIVGRRSAALGHSAASAA